MKKLFLLLALLGMVATGCSKDEVDKGDDNKTEQPNENEGGNEDNIHENIFFGLDKESVTISPDGGSVDVIVYSNYKWEISGTSDWCTPSVKGGDANEDGQKVTFSADMTYDDREATFWFRCADKQIKFIVLQKLKQVIIPDANNTFNFPAEGGVAVISYQTSVDCEVIIPKNAQSWITIAPASRGLVSENINLDIAENTTYSARTAVIKVVAKDNAELAVEYTINQEQKNGVLVDGNNTFNVSATGGSVLIKYQANVDCDVIIPEEAQSWITIAPATRGLVTYNTSLNIAENNSGKERSCVVKVVSKDDNELSAEYTITQKPRYCLYYTSNDGKIVQPYKSSAFGATIISNTYIDGVGIIEFNAPITKIGESTFYNSSRLTSITIPDSVTTIGDDAFRLCSSLTSVYITDLSAWCRISFGDYSANPLDDAGNLYLNNELVTDLVIPSDVTEIKNDAFCNCDSLTSVTIPDSVTTIGITAFYNCSSLTSVTIGDSVTTIGDFAFASCSSLTSVTIPDSVTTIGYMAFAYCSSLTSVTIGSGVTTIGKNAFSGCTGELIVNCNIPDGYYDSNDHEYVGVFCGSKFTSVTIGDSVTTIGEWAFYNCSSLTSVTIGSGVTTIGNSAFRDCSSLTSITIPDSVTTIGVYAFHGCSSLREFNGKYASEDGRYLIIDGTLHSFAPAGLTEYTIPNSVTTIGNGAFSGCSSLTSVTIGDSVTTIGGSAFSYCSNLTSITIPDSVTTIGELAFYNCSSLTSVTIPNSVTSIGDYAFQYCSSLKSVYCKAVTPPARGFAGYEYWSAFTSNARDRKIYVPKESVEAYKSAEGWSSYKSYIVGYNF